MDQRSELEQGLRHHQAGEFATAERIYRDVLSANPDNADAHHFLGLLAHQHAQVEDAIRLIGRAVELAPSRPTFHFNLGAAYLATGQQESALNAYRRAADLKPDWDEAWFHCGSLLGQGGRLEEAEGALRQAIEIRADYGEAHCALGAVLSDQGRAEEGVAACRLAISAAPNLAEAWTNLGNGLERLNQFEEAEQAHRQALTLDPNSPLIHYNLGNLLAKFWRLDDALGCFRAALKCDPAYGPAAGNLLIHSIYHPDQSEESLYNQHIKLNPLRPTETGHQVPTSDVDPGRKLRIGYVSPDFRTHSCAYFIEPLLAGHDAGRFEIFAYSDVDKPDGVTARLRALVDHWRDGKGLSDEAVAEAIRNDGIDILVDLAGHSANSRPRLFQLNPAPVQVSWLGYPSTTGLGEIDYRLTDSIADPVGPADRFHSEKLVRLEDGFLCYQPPAKIPDIAPSPHLANGYITFGSFNNLSKVTPQVIALWSRILQSVPNSRLLLKGRMLDVPPARANILASFEDAGISSDRVDLHHWIPREQSPLTLYSKVDIALDSFPYNGTTTSFEALLMGVPVLSLTGERHAGRVGASILTHIGTAELIAATEDAYLTAAVDLAQSPDQLTAYRRDLRQQLTTSSLGNGPAFSDKVEAAYVRMWQDWCAS